MSHSSVNTADERVAPRTLRRVLMTGGAGFIGSNLCYWLLRNASPPLESLVVVDDLRLAHGDEHLRDALANDARITLIKGDYGDAALMERTMREQRTDALLHLGAETHVDASFRDPIACAENNVIGTRRLLMAAQRYGQLAVFKHSSTDEVYGDASDEPCDEGAPMKPTNPYASSKVACEADCRVWHQAYGVPVVITRMNNVYGTRQASDKALPRFASLIATGQAVTIHGSGEQKRNWVHVDDACNALWTVATRGRISHSYNIGSPIENSVFQMARLIHGVLYAAGRCGPDLRLQFVGDRPHNDKHYRINWDRIRTELGWQPMVPFESALRTCVIDYANRAVKASLLLAPASTLARSTAHAVGVAKNHSGDTNTKETSAIGTHIENIAITSATSTMAASATTPSDSNSAAAATITPTTTTPASRPQKVLLYGHKGWIGGQFAALMTDAGVAWVGGETRPGDSRDADVAAELDRVAPTHVASFIGRTHGPGCGNIDFLEGGSDKLKLNLRDNLFGPALLAELCRQRGVKLLYLGTGCIFSSSYDDDGRVTSAAYTENDEPSFFRSNYSVAKGYLDRLMHQYGDTVLNARIRMPIADMSSRDLIAKIASYQRVIVRENSMTVLPEMLPVMMRMMLAGETGTHQFVNEPPLTHPQILEVYKEEIDPSHEIKTFTVEQQASVVKADRSNCVVRQSPSIAKYALAGEVTDSLTAIRKCLQRVKTSPEWLATHASS